MQKLGLVLMQLLWLCFLCKIIISKRLRMKCSEMCKFTTANLFPMEQPSVMQHRELVPRHCVALDGWTIGRRCKWVEDYSRSDLKRFLDLKKLTAKPYEARLHHFLDRTAFTWFFHLKANTKLNRLVKKFSLSVESSFWRVKFIRSWTLFTVLHVRRITHRGNSLEAFTWT